METLALLERRETMVRTDETEPMDVMEPQERRETLEQRESKDDLVLMVSTVSMVRYNATQYNEIMIHPP